MTNVPLGLQTMPILPTGSLPRTCGNARCLRKASTIISLVLVFGCLHTFAQPQQTTPGEERVKQVLQTLEPDNSLRHALEQGGRGDGIHHWWMDLMRQFGIKQVAFDVQFKYPAGKKDLKVTSIKYLQRYYPYDARITSDATIDQIRASGLEDGVKSAILNRARIFLNASGWGSEEFCGTLYLNLLDDEVLPILDEPADRGRCESSAKENAKTTPGEQRVKQILQTLEPDNSLRHALEQGGRGDGIHYWWMDMMRQFGVKQVAFRVQFQYPNVKYEHPVGPDDLKVTSTKYLLRYYRYDTPVTSGATLDQIRASGLEDGVKSEILRRSRIFLEQTSDPQSMGTCGTLYVDLLDDEVLPILDEPSTGRLCESGAKVSAARPPQNIRLTSKETRHTARPRALPPPVVSDETYHKVLDRVFPREILTNDKFDYVFVLRYEPAFQAESQITITERDGKIEVIKYTASESIEKKLNKLAALTSMIDVRRMARQIKIKKERLSVAARDIKVLRENFFEKLRISERTHPETLKNEITVAAGGTGYRLWYSGEIEIYSNFAGSNLMTPTRSDESPLLDWMKSVYLKVSFLPSTARR